MDQLKGMNWPLAILLLLAGVVAVYWLPAQAKGYGIGSFTALFIAFVAYPWQKNRDRELQIELERRATCAQSIKTLLTTRSRLDDIFHKKANSLQELNETTKMWLQAFHELERDVRTIAVMGSEEIILAGEKCVQSFHDILPDLLKEAKNQAASADKNGLTDEFFNSLKEINEKHAERLDDATSDFLSLVRREVFHMNGNVNFRSRVRDRAG